MAPINGAGGTAAFHLVDPYAFHMFVVTFDDAATGSHLPHPFVRCPLVRDRESQRSPVSREPG